MSASPVLDIQALQVNTAITFPDAWIPLLAEYNAARVPGWASHASPGACFATQAVAAAARYSRNAIPPSQPLKRSRKMPNPRPRAGVSARQESDL